MGQEALRSGLGGPLLPTPPGTAKPQDPLRLQDQRVGEGACVSAGVSASVSVSVSVSRGAGCGLQESLDLSEDAQNCFP